MGRSQTNANESDIKKFMRHNIHCFLSHIPVGKNCPFLKKRTESHKWETISQSMESVERNVNRLRQTDICIHLWDPFEGEK